MYENDLFVSDGVEEVEIEVKEVEVIRDGSGEYDFYKGDYSIIPKINSQIMDTKDKIMKDNVEVAAIPFHEVSNENGTTIVIGGIL